MRFLFDQNFLFDIQFIECYNAITTCKLQQNETKSTVQYIDLKITYRLKHFDYKPLQQNELYFNKNLML